MLDFGAPTGHQFVLVCNTSSVNKNSAVFTSSMYPILPPVNKNSAVITSSVSEKVQRHSNNKLIQVSSTKITKAQ